MVTYLLGLHNVFTAYSFTVKYNVLFGLFKYGLGLDLILKHLASLNIAGCNHKLADPKRQ